MEKEWPKTVAEARIEQQRLALSVCLKETLGEIEYVGGTDVGFREQGRITRAAITVHAYRTQAVVAQAVVELPTCFPYVPGYLSFRELPALVQCWQQLKVKPQLLLCDGQGIAHPLGFGLASHLGVVLGISTIGVAKSRLIGEYSEPAVEQGAEQPLHYKGKQVGWVFRSKTRVKPIFISPGHQVSVAQSLHWVRACCRGYKLPEPTRMADKLSK